MSKLPADYRSPTPHLSAATIASLPQVVRPHPLDPLAVRSSVSLSEATSLLSQSVSLNRVAPGAPTTVLHRHLVDEEWIYILSGRGTAVFETLSSDMTHESQCAGRFGGKDEVGLEEVPVGPGDFFGHLANGRAHAMRAHPDAREDLVYLCGGARSERDVCEYPHIGKRLDIDRTGKERKNTYTDVKRGL
ncbi:hypothetical protein HKX48_005802 [Thoreauomyces humboldtii]|nr:hypothetical protein HKX48_005802 [Thoreauomyces humboldtii]